MRRLKAVGAVRRVGVVWTRRPLGAVAGGVGVVLMLALLWAGPAGAYLFWTSPETGAIGRADTDGSGERTILRAEKLDSGIAVGSHHIYWSWSGGIGRANLDGTEADPSFIALPEGVTGVAVTAEHIYWGGPGGKIGRAALNGTAVEPEFISPIPGGSITGLAVSKEYVYWSNFWDSAIGRAKLNGTEVVQELAKKTHTPVGLALNEEFLYWAITYENHIGRALLDGEAVNTNFISTGLSSAANEQVGVAVAGGRIYWANPTTGTIGRANLAGGEIEPSFVAGAGAPEGLAYAPGAEAEAAPATELTTSSAELNASVNPRGVAVETCKFEYGTTEAYGKSAPCSPSPGSGSSPVAVSATVTGLASGTAYHYRVNVDAGEALGTDESFATFTASGSATASGEAPVTATSGPVSATASGGPGTVVAGRYGATPGGPLLPNGSGAYFDVYRTPESSFTKIVIKYCEAGAATSAWWFDPSVGWELVTPSAVAVAEGCLSITVTPSTNPSVAQLTGTRIKVGEPPGSYGQCRKSKDVLYSDSACRTEHGKNGVPDDKGKYEWYSAPVACFPQKKGHFRDSGCTERDEKKGKPVGGYESGDNGITLSAASAQLQLGSAGTVSCTGLTGTGALGSAYAGYASLTLTGCKLSGQSCSSEAGAGVIFTSPLEAVSAAEPTSEGYYLILTSPDTFMRFTCNGIAYTVSGGAAGRASGMVSTMTTSSTAEYSSTAGIQELTVTYGSSQASARFVATITEKTEQPFELDPAIVPG